MKLTVTVQEKIHEEEAHLYVQSLDSPVIDALQPLADLKPVFFTDENGHQVKVKVSEILYFEAVDKKSFVYLSNSIYEASERLYQLEERYRSLHFCRVSKSIVLNLKKIKKIYPTVSGKFEVILENDERLSVSRSYVKALRAQLDLRKRVKR